MAKTRDEINELVLEVIGEMTADWDLGGTEIDAETGLGMELGLSSVDMLTLMSRIDFRLGSRIDYERLVVQDDGRFVDEVTVAELVDFVTENQDAAAAEPSKM